VLATLSTNTYIRSVVSILIDNNLLLRSYHVEDARDLFQAVNESRAHLRPWLIWVDSTTKQEHSLQFIQMSLQQQHSQEALALGIFYNRKIIGGIGMHHWDHVLEKAYLGYWISKEYEGQGIVNKCLERFIDFIFDKVGLNKLEIHFIPSNKRSACVAERLGFKVEGVLRDSYVVNGVFTDIVITGLLKKEWHDK
jgi:ribosomal-protein-serine acetyltransferase